MRNGGKIHFVERKGKETVAETVISLTIFTLPL